MVFSWLRRTTEHPDETEQQPLLPQDGCLQETSERSLCLASSPELKHEALHHPAFTVLKQLAVMLNFFICGVIVTGIGVLLPEIGAFYGLKDGTTALIFPTAVTGYVCSTVVVELIHGRLGRRGIAFLSPAIRLVAMSLLATGSSFHVTLAGYFLGSFGIGLSDAGFCAWATSVPYASIVQGFMHGSFSVGSILGPQVANLMLKKGFKWFEFYRMTGLLLVIELVVLGIAFRLDDADHYSANHDDSDEVEPHSHNALTHRATWICGAFCFFYVGLEGCFTDWIAVYMRRARHTDPTTSSLATSMFWIGMSTGRFTLGPLSQYIGVRMAVAGYLLALMVLQVLFRLLTNVTASLLLVAGSGLFCGPIFPSAILLLSLKLPSRAQVGAVAAVGALGQVGAGIAPFAVGQMADSLGIKHLLTMILGLSALALLVWAVFARLPKATSELRRQSLEERKRMSV
ncbi:hypothetical protein A1O1_08847 [Capronia coronata CBS 617.96]|uniref:Major facilitator superfamily (MFS) profile domain-containing protein n=1 Tax=Capronia coronata CBS 617.96 TaxID=1182541 RepID=W9XDA1_9EURO|nr:uncharacterized protein A1O1_08847 [Capronia coronata CBS 617.96]EXJ78447.1 hypothetical protein A1O1_08847 [Capronia coronata CBS 617.96]